jgi:hypothetical protein
MGPITGTCLAAFATLALDQKGEHDRRRRLEDGG